MCGVKIKSPLYGEAVSGLEIRFRGLLRDSDQAPAQAGAGTTTRRTETGAGAAIHDGKSYIDIDVFAKGKIHRGSRLGGAFNARRLAALADCCVYLKSNSSNRSLIAGPFTGT